MKSTPAPWTIHGFAIYGGSDGERLVASIPCADWSDDPYERRHAAGHEEAGFNSALIAKAPDMLNALREILYAWDDDSKTALDIKLQSPMDDARDLIAYITAGE